MGQQLPRVGVKFLENCVAQTQRILNDWTLFSQLLMAYTAPGADQGKLEMQFLETKSRLAREVSVMKGRIGAECAFETETINVIAGCSTLHQTYSQSEVSVRKLQSEWHRCYIAINETLGDLQELERKVRAGQPVIFAGKLIKIQKPIPWKRIAAGVAAVLLVCLSLYVMRYFLGFWAPKAGVGYETAAGVSDEDQLNIMLGRLKGAFDRRELDVMMSAFADDFQDVEGRDKTMLRALLQSYATMGLNVVQLDIERAVISLNGERASVSPVNLTTPQGNLVLIVEGEKRDGQWLITYINGA